MPKPNQDGLVPEPNPTTLIAHKKRENKPAVALFVSRSAPFYHHLTAYVTFFFPSLMYNLIHATHLYQEAAALTVVRAYPALCFLWASSQTFITVSLASQELRNTLVTTDLLSVDDAEKLSFQGEVVFKRG